eukprot:6148923-Alexandrium_andersonii.AAC.1
MCAKLCRSLYGAPAAPARREAWFSSVLESFGFVRGKASARCFYNAELDVRRVVRGGDFTFAGHDADLGVVENLTNEKQERGRLGGGAKDLQEVKLLNRII